MVCGNVIEDVVYKSGIVMRVKAYVIQHCLALNKASSVGVRNEYL